MNMLPSSFAMRDWRSARKSQGGFTLVELLVVIALISLLAAMAVVQYRNSIQKTQEATLKTNLFRMRDAIDQYYADKGKYPSSLDALVSDQYLRKIPDDPITRSATTWQVVAPADSGKGRVYDVRSGASGKARNGSAYDSW